MTETVVLLVMGGGFLALAGWLLLLTSHHAYRRGYNPIVWALAAVIAMNPIFLFVVLALVPNRARLRLRAKFAAELDARLAGGDPCPGPRGDRSMLAETQMARTQGARSPAHPAIDATQTFLGNDPGLDGRPG